MRNTIFPYALPGRQSLPTSGLGALAANPGILDLFTSQMPEMPEMPQDNFDPRSALMGGALMDLSEIILGKDPSNNPMRAYQMGKAIYDKDQMRKYQQAMAKYGAEQQNFANTISAGQLMATLAKDTSPADIQMMRSMGLNPEDPADVAKYFQMRKQPKGLSTADLNEVAAGVAEGKIPPTDSRYAVWWMMNSQPRVNFDTTTGVTTTITPDLSRFPVPPESALNKAATDDQQTDQPTDEQPIEMGSEGGVTVTQTNKPMLTGVELKNARDQIFQAETIMADLDRLKGLATQYFKNPLDVKLRDQIGTLYGAIQIAYKEFANLGVLTGPDMDIIENFLANPTDLFTMTKNITGVGDYNAQLSEALKSFERARDRLNAKIGNTSSTTPNRSTRVDALLEKVK